MGFLFFGRAYFSNVHLTEFDGMRVYTQQIKEKFLRKYVDIQ